MILSLLLYIFFFFNDTATTEIYTLSLHDALPISWCLAAGWSSPDCRATPTARLTGAGSARSSLEMKTQGLRELEARDRKSTRLNSSHSQISYAVFCLKKKNEPHLTFGRNASSQAT